MRTSSSPGSYSTAKRPPWQVRTLVAGFLLLLTVIYFRRQVLGGQALYWGDIGLYFAPMQGYLKQHLNAGRLPLWNPLVMCGTPYVGNPQTWPLYPITALLPFVSATQFINLTVALHVWIAGLGTYAFARRALGVGSGPALLAAITFMFGGQLVSKEQFPNMVQAAAWLPWALFCLHNLIVKKRLRDSLALGLALGLQLLAAHVQMTLLTLYVAAAYGLFLSAGRLRRRVRLLLLLSLAVASGLAMGQLLPTLALFRDATRHRLSFAVVDRFYLPFNQLGNFVLPHLHGNPFAGDWTGRGNSWETCCYVGALPLGLALWGSVSGWPAGRFWACVFLAGLWMALGGQGGLYHLAYFVLPGFRSFHDPARCLLWSCFALSLLAALGLSRLPKRFRVSFVTAAICLLSFADLAHFNQTLSPLAKPSALSPVSPNVAAVLADPDIADHQARILAPTGGVWLRFTNYKDFRQTVSGYQSLWADTLVPNSMMAYGLQDAFGYEPVALKNADTVTGRAAWTADAKAFPEDRAEAAALSSMLAVKYLAVCRVTPPEATTPGLALIRTAPTLAPPGNARGLKAAIYLSRNTLWQPRARLEREAMRVRIVGNDPDRVTLTFATSAPDRLLLADTQAPGWTASLDGAPAPIETYNGCLRAVSVTQPGPHRVVFAYAPTAFRLGLYVSLLTLAGLFGATSYFAANRPRTEVRG